MTSASTSNSPIHLGLAFELEPEQLFTLERHFLPLGKVGGFPAWLNPATVPQSAQLECANCGSPMGFLLQIYCTDPQDPPHAFHRVLYVFVCRKGECSRTNDASNFAVFRAQLPRQNSFYSPVEALRPSLVGQVPDPFYDANIYAQLCTVCGCRAGKRCAKCSKRMYCSREHQIIDWKSAHKEECGSSEQKEFSALTSPEKLALRQKHAASFREYGMEMCVADASGSSEESDDEDDDEEDGATEEKEVEAGKLREEDRRKIREYEELAKASGINSKELEGLKESRQDAAFRRFSQALEQEPDQVLRYQRGGQPLLATDFSPAPLNVPDCPICEQPRQFECQLMPHLLTIIDVDSVQESSLDWATLLIYTCRANCPIPEDGYAREWVFKQDFVEAPKEE